uniref:Putative secreted protein n=1 Tax=Anopheles darlingi TaxID=43151 RepID=A0A2M4DKU8_ANODA
MCTIVIKLLLSCSLSCSLSRVILLKISNPSSPPPSPPFPPFLPYGPVCVSARQSVRHRGSFSRSFGKFCYSPHPFFPHFTVSRTFFPFDYSHIHQQHSDTHTDTHRPSSITIILLPLFSSSSMQPDGGSLCNGFTLSLSLSLV